MLSKASGNEAFDPIVVRLHLKTPWRARARPRVLAAKCCGHSGGRGHARTPL